MAEKANIYFTSETKPTVFEIIAQRSLNTTLEPALKKIVLFLGDIAPKYFRWLGNNYDETFLVFNAALQYHYYRNYNSSFSEYFYGLKRLRKDDYELTIYQKQLSWIYNVIGQYVKKKLLPKIEEYKYENAETALNKNFKGLLKQYLIYLHTSFELFWGGWILLTYLRYMADKCDHQLPLLKILNLKLVYRESTDDINFWVALVKGNLGWKKFQSDILENLVKGILEVSAFIVQFLQVWSLEKANFDIRALPVIPALEADTKAINYKNKCPICFQTFKIPTLLPVSGYVFCFVCILKYLKENEKCPVTNFPAEPLDIIRLYDSQ